jgi:hypothetical protein
MGKYRDVPIEKREERRWTDMSEYLDGKITLEELNDREQGDRHGSKVTDNRGPSAHGKKGNRSKSGISFR